MKQTFLFPVFQQVHVSVCLPLPLQEGGGKKRCTWKKMDPCLHIMSARIRMKHVWTWQDLSKGFDSQVGAPCIGTAVVIPALAPSSSPQRIPPPLQESLRRSQSSWTATVYNQTSSSSTLLVSPTLQCDQRHRTFISVRSAAHEYPPQTSVDTAIPVTPGEYLVLGGPPVTTTVRNCAEISCCNS